MSDTAHIFISHAQHDRAVALHLAEGLTALGMSVWMYEHDADTPLPQWLAAEIEQALSAASLVLVLWSTHSVTDDWVLSEAQVAYKNKKILNVQLHSDIALPAPFDRLHSHQFNNLDRLTDTRLPPGLVRAIRDFNLQKPITTVSRSSTALETDAQSPLPIDAPLAPGSPSAASTTDLPTALRAQLVARALATQHGSWTQQTAPRSPPPPEGAPALKRRAASPQLGWILGTLIRYGILAGGLALCVWLGGKLIPVIFAATTPRSVGRSAPPPDDTVAVEASVFSPPKLAVNDQIMVQVFLHPPGRADDAAAGAQQFDTDAQWRGFTSLSLELAAGTRVAVQLDVADLTVSDEGVGEIRWQNGVIGLSFLVAAPSDAALGKRHGTVRFLVDGVPAGRIHFALEVVATRESAVAAQPLGDSSHRYRRAFISYASEDRAEVLKRVQTLGALKIDYFQDVLSLEPGDRWQQELYREIDRCDLFLLFWSSASQASMWVRREAQYALERQHASADGEPDLIPLILEGPPPPAPWPELSGLHFNDKLIYLVRIEQGNPAQ